MIFIIIMFVARHTHTHTHTSRRRRRRRHRRQHQGGKYKCYNNMGNYFIYTQHNTFICHKLTVYCTHNFVVFDYTHTYLYTYYTTHGWTFFGMLGGWEIVIFFPSYNILYDQRQHRATILTILVSFIHVINFCVCSSILFLIHNIKFCVPSRHKIVVVFQ